MKNFFKNAIIFGIIIILNSSGIAWAQNYMSNVEKIIPYQAGTSCIISGVSSIKLSDSQIQNLGKVINTSYFVSLTPIGDCGSLKLLKKDNNEFTVQEIQFPDAKPQSNEHCFDYVVFRKQIIEFENKAIKQGE